MTAIFKVIVQKHNQGVFWVNDYLVRADDMDGAIGAAQIIWPAEQAFHNTDTTINKFRVSTVTPNDGLFFVGVVDLAGTHSSNGNPLALFDVVRVDFPRAGFGLPGRKFYRAVLGSSDVTGYTAWGGATLTLVETSTTDMVNDLAANDTPLVTAGDALYTAAVVFESYTNRQLRRGSKRPSTPII